MDSMTLTTFALIRHGQTDWNAQRRLQGSTDIPLNDVGRAQARDAVAVLSAYEWDAIASSPLSRAAETADLIAAGLGLSDVRRVPELTERSFGPAEGLQAGSVAVNGGTNDWEINGPFGGYKKSGIGRELGEDSLRAFTNAKTISFSIL